MGCTNCTAGRVTPTVRMIVRLPQNSNSIGYFAAPKRGAFRRAQPLKIQSSSMRSRKPTGPQSRANRQRVGINAHLLSGEASYRRAGIHQYILQILRHLPVNQDGPEYLIYSRSIDGLPANRAGVSIKQSSWPTNRRLVRIAWEQLAWPLVAGSEKLDLLHSMAFVTPLLSPCPTVVTVYDLSFIRFPDRFARMQRLYLASQAKRSCRQSRRVITISDSGRQDVHKQFGVPLEKIDVVNPGVDKRFRPLPSSEIDFFRQRHGLPNQFILHVGTLQPRKNIPLLLEAYAQLALPGVKLVLVGGEGWMFGEIHERVEALGLEKEVIFTGYVPDSDLPLWYNAADLFVFPSVYEGFGMPVVEAMACGAPVVAADSSSIPEAAGDAALLFDPSDSSELADRMRAVLLDAELSAKMQGVGVEQASQFSWQRAARETAGVHERALAA